MPVRPAASPDRRGTAPRRGPRRDTAGAPTLERQETDCPFCGETILTTAKKCRHCGEFIDPDDEGEASDPAVARGRRTRGRRHRWRQAPDDKLEGHWYALVWCSLLIPCVGSWIIVILTSVLYYAWRRDHPEKANTINLHGWLAFLVGHLIGLFLYLALRR